MSLIEKLQEARKTWLEQRMDALSALYEKFGREGLKSEPLQDVALLLAHKEMKLRDAPRGGSLSEQLRESNRLAELEVRDLRAYLAGVTAGAGLGALRPARETAPQRPGNEASRPAGGPAPDRGRQI